MSDFWNMPNPLSPESDYWPDLQRSVAALGNPAWDDKLARYKGPIIGMLQAKADADHRLVLTAIAAELAQKGIDVGPAPW